MKGLVSFGVEKFLGLDEDDSQKAPTARSVFCGGKSEKFTQKKGGMATKRCVRKL